MSRTIGALLGIVGVLGLVLLAVDQALRKYAPSNFDALIGFVIVDFALATLVFTKPSKRILMLAAVWGVVRIVLQMGDVFQAPIFQFSYGQFANYLFNPLNSVEDNPPGIPGAVIDLMLVVQLAIVGLGWKAIRAFKPTPSPTIG